MLQRSFAQPRSHHFRLAQCLVLATLVWSGCDRGEDDESRSPSSITLADPSAPVAHSTAETGGGPDAQATDGVHHFGAFWVEFRRAALDGNTAALLSMTELPFHTRGPLDEDPLVEHDSAAFVAILPRLLAADPGLSARPSTMRRLLEAAVTPPAGIVELDEARVGDFVFARRGGRWRFARAYLSDPLHQ